MTSPRGTATVGGNMRRERQARNLTLETLADRLGLKRAAPLSTFERSPHVPKADTIKEYAAAIGCTPADLLAGVVTEYDVLRGASAPTPAQASESAPLSAVERRALRLLGMMSDAGQRHAVALLAESAKAFPREPRQELDAQSVQTTDGTVRRERRKR